MVVIEGDGKLEIGKLLGIGAHARVYEGMLQGHGPCAVKVLKASQANDPLHRGDFQRECDLLQSIAQTNICRCVGFVRLPAGFPGLCKDDSAIGAILQLGVCTLQHVVSAAYHSRPRPMASLQRADSVSGPRNPVITAAAAYSQRQALTWILELAKALSYLHGLSPIAIHRDIKLENVVLVPAEVPVELPVGPGTARTLPVGFKSTCFLTDFGLHQRIWHDQPVLLRRRQRPTSVDGPGKEADGSSPGTGTLDAQDLFFTVDTDGVARSTGSFANAVSVVSAMAATSGHGFNRHSSNRSTSHSSLPLSVLRPLSLKQQLSVRMATQHAPAHSPSPLSHMTSESAAHQQATMQSMGVRQMAVRSEPMRTDTAAQQEVGHELEADGNGTSYVTDTLQPVSTCPSTPRTPMEDSQPSPSIKKHRRITRSLSARMPASISARIFRTQLPDWPHSKTDDDLPPVIHPHCLSSDSDDNRESPSAPSSNQQHTVLQGDAPSPASNTSPTTQQQTLLQRNAFTTGREGQPTPIPPAIHRLDMHHSIQGVIPKPASLVSSQEAAWKLAGSCPEAAPAGELRAALCRSVQGGTRKSVDFAGNEEALHSLAADLSRRQLTTAAACAGLGLSRLRPATLSVNGAGVDGSEGPSGHSTTNISACSSRHGRSDSQGRYCPSTHKGRTGRSMHSVQEAMHARVPGDLVVVSRDGSQAQLMPFAAQQQEFHPVWSLTGETGSFLTMSPEVFKRQPYNASADVFSLALVAWEVLARTPLAYLLRTMDVHQPRDFAVELSVGYRPPQPKDCSLEIWQLLELCWSQDPTARPTSRQMVAELSRILKSPSATVAVVKKESSFMKTHVEAPEPIIDKPKGCCLIS